MRKLEWKFCKKPRVSKVEGILAENGKWKSEQRSTPAFRRRREIPEYNSRIVNDFGCKYALFIFGF